MCKLASINLPSSTIYFTTRLGNFAHFKTLFLAVQVMIQNELVLINLKGNTKKNIIVLLERDPEMTYRSLCQMAPITEGTVTTSYI